uniref:Legume lectin domain-containing protein n=2 Tax=Nymphaea colorata TaxID=210225 RepID=A0A5K1HWJ3_9MAGN|nr:unnamed protein product [Nymphaea colorata]
MEPGIKGNAFFTASLQFKKPTASKRTKSFSIHFVFAIVSKAHQSGGHGFVFIVALSPNFSNAMGGRLFGLFSIRNNENTTNQIFVVEFNIVQHTNLHDIDESHVGVDINGVNSSVSEPAAYYTGNHKKEQGVLDGQTPIQAWIEYDGPMKQLNVTIAPLSHQLKPNCILNSRSIDLSPVLLEHMYVGFSFGTHKLVSKCYILAWSFAMDGKVLELDLSHLPSIPQDCTPLWKSFKLYLYISVALVALLFIIVTFSISYLTKRKRKLTSEKIEGWEMDYPHKLPYRVLTKIPRRLSR